MTRKILVYIVLVIGIVINVVVDININNYIEILNYFFNQQIVLQDNIYALICTINALIWILIIINMKLIVEEKQNEIDGFKLKRKDGTFGTANWMNEKEMKEILSTSEISGIILGKYNNEIIKLPFNSYFNKNICVFGSSRKYENERISFDKRFRT